MSRLIKLTVLVAVLLPVVLVKASSPINPTRKFDEFGDIKCEDEYARLDDFAIQLQHEPQAKGVLNFYGGKISFWLQPASYDQPQFKEAWGRNRSWWS